MEAVAVVSIERAERGTTQLDQFDCNDGKKTTASSSGAFRMSFGNVAIGRCSGFRITAVGNLGSRATLKRTPLPACLPA